MNAATSRVQKKPTKVGVVILQSTIRSIMIRENILSQLRFVIVDRPIG